MSEAHILGNRGICIQWVTVMKKIRDDGYMAAKRIQNGETSFYGIHRGTQAGLIPKTSFAAPINDLYGPHLYFEGMLWEDNKDLEKRETP